MSIRTLAVATAMMAGLGMLAAVPATAQTVNPSIGANAGLGGQPGLLNPVRICGLNVKCADPSADQSGTKQPSTRGPRR